MADLNRPLVWTPEQARQQDRRDLGGKTLGLLRLRSLDLRVPDFLVVPGSVFRSLLAPWDPPLAALSREVTDQDLQRLSGRVQEHLRQAPLPAGLGAALRAALAQHLPGGPPLAVRSSAADEDGRRHSFAGIHESELFVRGHEPLLESLRRVWCSAVAPRALRYRLAHGLSTAGIRLAVVLQEMVDAEVSGVLFTADPARGDVHRCTLSALYGLGEGLVSQGLEADLYQVDKHTGAVTTTAATKDLAVVAVPAGTGVRRTTVSRERRDRPCLTEDTVRALARIGQRVERAAGHPQDLEFCLDAAGRVTVLQTRTITTLEEDGPAAGNPILWDNSNIVESYAGVTTPMTFAFLRQAYAGVYRSFAAFMGVPRREIRNQERMFEQMLGLIRGRVYYNLRHWYQLVRLFPAYRFNRRFLESMMGVSEELAEDAPAPGAGRLRRWLVEAPRTLWLLLRAGWAFGRLGTLVRRFEQRFERLDRRWGAVDLEALDPAGCERFYRDMEERLLQQWRVPIINDFHVMIHYGVLRRLCERWLGPDQIGLHNELLCRTGGIRSTEPAHRLDALAERARQSPELVRRILADPSQDPGDWLDPEGPDPGFVQEVRAYLDAFGDRCADELKLESVTLREDPEPLRGMLALRLQSASRQTDGSSPAGERAQDDPAERRARTLLRQQRFGRVKSALFFRVLHGARQGVRNRENLRLLRTRVFGRVRAVIRRLGRWLAEEELLERTEDVFLLTLDEVFDLVHGTAVSTDLRGLVAARQREYQQHREAEPPADRFQTHGLVHHRNACRARADANAAAGDGTLRGVPCCPGRVTAGTRLVRDPHAPGDLRGRILVAERTDPGWVPLFPLAAGLLVQRGSILSHSAIVARELGLPTVVGVPGLVRALADEPEVTLDGARGTVERLFSPCAAARSRTPSSGRSAPGTRPRRTPRTSPP